MRMNMKEIIPTSGYTARALLITSIAIAWAALIAGCGGSQRAVDGDGVPVAVVPVVRGEMDADFDRAGVFRPYQEINLYAKVSGYVKRINVDIGDRVKKGQLLAVLEVPELVAEMEHSKAAVARSQADLKRAEDELARAKSEYDVVHLSYGRLAGVAKTQPGIVAQQELDASQGQDRQAEAGVSAAEAAVASAQQQLVVDRAELQKDQSMLDYAQIIAPFDGVVTQRFADTGAMVAAGISSEKQALPVLQLAQNDVLRLDIPVPESVVPSIREGDSVQVHVGAMNRDFEGKVVRFSRQLDESTRTMITEIDVPNANLTLVPGMYADVKIRLQHRQSVLCVPIVAIVRGEGKPWALAVDSTNHVGRREVALGVEDARRAEVLSGLREGEMVVAANQEELKSGQLVKPKQAALADGGAAPGGEN
jgi:RND family efflux transporter MFP subunit